MSAGPSSLASTAPGGKFLSLNYGPEGSISSIQDSRGRQAEYKYDRKNRLVCATYPSGEIFSYTYDNTQHLLTFSVATNASITPRLILTNTYEHGRVTSQTLADGTVFEYRYTPQSGAEARLTLVSTPEGKVYEVWIDGEQSAIRERTGEPGPGFTARAGNGPKLAIRPSRPPALPAV